MARSMRSHLLSLLSHLLSLLSPHLPLSLPPSPELELAAIAFKLVDTTWLCLSGGVCKLRSNTVFLNSLHDLFGDRGSALSSEPATYFLDGVVDKP